MMPRALARTTIAPLFATLVATLVACSGEGGQPCYAGDWAACTCDDGGASGYQQCDPAGQAYLACDCSGNYPTLGIYAEAGADGGGDAPAGDAAEAGGGHTMDQPCMTNSDCAPGLVCFHFNARGPECTHACTMDSQCEAPSPGCSMMMVCKST